MIRELRLFWEHAKKLIHLHSSIFPAETPRRKNKRSVGRKPAALKNYYVSFLQTARKSIKSFR